jgi:hypothetical protein
MNLNVLTKALRRLEALLLDLTGPPPVVVPGVTPATNDQPVLLFNLRTVNAVATTQASDYAPPDGHAAQVSGGMCVTDRTAHTTSSANSNASIRNYGGLAVAAQLTAGHEGDGALATATFAIGVSGGGFLQLTVTPPGGYVGTLDWVVILNIGPVN